MTKKINIWFLIYILCFSSTNSFAYEFSFKESEFVKFNGAELNGDQIRQIEFELNKLSAQTKEIYSRPTYEIIYRNNGGIRYISIFEKENFVYSGHYLDAWTDRMQGNKSDGFELSKSFKKLCKNGFNP